MTAPTMARDPATDRDAASLAAARTAVAALFGEPASRTVAVRDWDGSVEHPGGGHEPRCTVVVPSAARLRRALLPPSELGLAEAFVRGDLDVDGDLEVATAMADDVRARLRDPRAALRALGALLALPRARASTAASDARPRTRWTSLAAHGWRHTRRRDRTVVRAHYDVGNDFYALWLDGALVYSCAYYPEGDEDIDAAQRAKLDLICRKLRLREGERLLDIGCGWGGLIRHAAREYGVRALGITLSERQAELARARIAADGLERRCWVEVRDCRELPADASFDKVVSVGMFEHVGHERMPAYFRAAVRLTRPGGLFLNHDIVRLRDERGTLAERLERGCGAAAGSSIAGSFPTASSYRSPSRSGARSRRASRRATWSRCASTTRARCGSGAVASSGRARWRRRSLAPRRIGRGGSTSPDRRTPSRAAASASRRCSSRVRTRVDA